MKLLYAVVVLTEEDLTCATGGARTVCLATTLERAQQVVNNNIMDIHEGLYEYAIIEALTADVPYGYSPGAVQLWYRWDTEPARYMLIENPKPDTVAWWQ